MPKTDDPKGWGWKFTLDEVAEILRQHLAMPDGQYRVFLYTHPADPVVFLRKVNA